MVALSIREEVVVVENHHIRDFSNWKMKISGLLKIKYWGGGNYDSVLVQRY